MALDWFSEGTRTDGIQAIDVIKKLREALAAAPGEAPSGPSPTSADADSLQKLIGEARSYCERHNLPEEDFCYFVGLMGRAAADSRLEALRAGLEKLRDDMRREYWQSAKMFAERVQSLLDSSKGDQ
jgi:hypothetical protein